MTPLVTPPDPRDADPLGFEEPRNVSTTETHILDMIRRSRPTVDSPTYRKLMARPSRLSRLIAWLRRG